MFFPFSLEVSLILLFVLVLCSAQMYGLLSDVPEECDEVCTIQV